MKNRPIILVVFIVIISCTDNNFYKTKEINIINGFNEQKQVLLSKIATDIKTVYLENTDNSLIGSVDQVFIDTLNKLIIVSDDMIDQILIFDINGKYLTKICNIGEGPGEYNEISDIAYFPKTKSIYIFDMNLSKILKYNAYGEFIDYFRIPPEILATKMRKHGNTITLIIPRPLFLEDKGYYFVAFDTTGNIIKRFYKHKKDCCKLGDKIPSQMLDYFKDSLLYMESLIQTIYKASPDFKCIPYYDIRCNRKPPSEDILKDYNKYIKWRWNNNGIFSFKETDKYIFFNAQKTNLMWNVFYEKETKDNYMVMFDLDLRDNGFVNNLNGGMPFWPNGRVNDNVLINVYNPQELKEIITSKYIDTIHIKFLEKYKDLVNHLDSCSLETNPFIDIVTLKKNW